MIDLTICIPVYNDKDYLLRQLDILYPQVRSSGLKIKIFDNDPFSDFSGANLSNKYPGAQYFCHPRNVGADMNILTSLLSCETKWVWVLSVNDIVRIDCIDRLLNLFRFHENEDALFYHLGQSVSKVYYGIEDFVRIVNYEDSFTISRCIYNNYKLREVLPDYLRVVKTNQGQAYMLFSYLMCNKETAFVLSEYDPIQSYLPSQWSKKVFIKGTFRILKDYRGLFQSDKFLFRLLKDKVQKMLYFQLFIARSYQGLDMHLFLFFFVKITLMNFANLDKFKVYCFIRMIFQRKYYMIYRRKQLGISLEEDFVIK
jgi:hypothetical protein